MLRNDRGETGPPAKSWARATYCSVVSVALLLSASESAAAPASPISLYCRLQRGDEGQVCSWRDRAAGAKLGARDLLQRRQRRVALERLRERRGARVADLVAPQAAATRVRYARGETGPPAQSRARATYSSSVSKLNAFASLSLFLPLLSSSSTTALAFIIASPLTLLQTSAS
jgi:hypothetical protein